MSYTNPAPMQPVPNVPDWEPITDGAITDNTVNVPVGGPTELMLHVRYTPPEEGNIALTVRDKSGGLAKNWTEKMHDGSSQTGDSYLNLSSYVTVLDAWVWITANRDAGKVVCNGCVAGDGSKTLNNGFTSDVGSVGEIYLDRYYDSQMELWGRSVDGQEVINPA